MTDYSSGPGNPGAPGRFSGTGQPPGVPGQTPGYTGTTPGQPGYTGTTPGQPGYTDTIPGQTPGYSDPTLYPATTDSTTQQPWSDEPQTAKDEARRVAGTTRDAGANVAQTAKDQAADVATEAKQQVASLLDTVRSEVGQQAGTQQHRIAQALHGLSDELGSMASSSSESGPLTELAKEGSRRGGAIADWLSEREPGDLLDEVRRYARRQPMTFLALCGITGLVAGRLTRGAVASRTSLDSPSTDERPRATAGPLATPATGLDPRISASAVDPRTNPPVGTGPSTPPRGGVTPSGW